MRLFDVYEKEGLIVQQRRTTFAEFGQRQWAAKIESPDVVPIERPREAALIVKERIGVQGFIPDEVVGSSLVVFSTALGHNVNQRTTIVAVLGGIVVSK